MFSIRIKIRNEWVEHARRKNEKEAEKIRNKILSDTKCNEDNIKIKQIKKDNKEWIKI